MTTFITQTRRLKRHICKPRNLYEQKIDVSSIYQMSIYWNTRKHVCYSKSDVPKKVQRPIIWNRGSTFHYLAPPLRWNKSLLVLTIGANSINLDSPFVDVILSQSDHAILIIMSIICKKSNLLKTCMLHSTLSRLRCRFLDGSMSLLE